MVMMLMMFVLLFVQAMAKDNDKHLRVNISDTIPLPKLSSPNPI